MPSLTLSQCLIWFAHCPKAGGTSVEKLMVAVWGDRVGNLHWGWDLWWRKEGWRLADPPNSPQHLTWADAKAVLPRQPDAIFALVRDPLTRMTSEYRWQRQGRRGTLAGKALAYLPFSLWLRISLRVGARNPHAFDNHLRPQGDFIPKNACVFRLENGLAPVVAWLSETTGADLAERLIPHALATNTQVSPITPCDAALIGRVFATDYHRFAYLQPQGASGRFAIDLVAAMLAPVVTFLDRRGCL